MPICFLFYLFSASTFINILKNLFCLNQTFKHDQTAQLLEFICLINSYYLLLNKYVYNNVFCMPSLRCFIGHGVLAVQSKRKRQNLNLMQLSLLREEEV
jgi:hypothetical protein